MKTLGRIVVFVVVLVAVVLAIVMIGVHTEGGQELIRSRLASRLAMEVDFDDARLAWPGALVLEGVAVQVREGDDVSVAEMKELRLSYRCGRRVEIRLRRPDILIRQSVAGDWQPSSFTPLLDFTNGMTAALEAFSAAFREQADVYVEDGTIQFADASEAARLTLGGVTWHCVRVSLPDSGKAYHQRFVRYGGTGLTQADGRPAAREWFTVGERVFTAPADTEVSAKAAVLAVPAVTPSVAPQKTPVPAPPPPAELDAQPEPESPAAAATREAA